ncbi:prepilin-type N-terminal cleavage/methylation domain-containing protein [Stenotrophomonas sp. SY1]|uniref:PilW family protein n=1 Tax=Stenotrophomonas sp. SY1 TaxID=477235 RepID=UPI001E2EB62A|nr:prepilin-type N-terminal cleavage/methylation domain-containing protein [Stenotrophomonas sp. SY1]MCD9086515.1 prepilin-type N-terminal cleavage/methylation domain-containing protein [Stenotrophomonas sp. SY1]
MNRRVRSGLSTFGRSAGFSLIELMIALVLGLMVIGAAFVMFQSNRNSFRAAEGVNRIQEGARVAFELMSADIRSTGGGGCSSSSTVETTGDLSLAYRDAPISGSGSELTLVSGEDAAYKVTASTTTSVTLDATQIDDATEVFEAEDVILLCNARKSYVVEVVSVDASTITFAALPESYNLTDDERVPPSSVVVARLRSTRWYVADNPRGGSSLYVSRFGQAGEEVVEGVQSVAFSYLPLGSSSYTATPGVWTDIIGVRADLVLEGENVDGKALTRRTSNVVSLRSRTL